MFRIAVADPPAVKSTLVGLIVTVGKMIVVELVNDGVMVNESMTV